MKIAPVILLLALATSSSASLLDMSQVVWSRVLNGGYNKVGKLDPLLVPVIKVDQSEGNTSYRVILRNLEVSGLNASRIESVHIVRGSLRSNLSDSEAGYVSYNEQRGLDSVRYRFHTLVKEPKGQGDEAEQRATEQFERIVQFDPTVMRVSEQDDLARASGAQGEQRQRYAAGQQQQQTSNAVFQANIGDMRVVMNSTPKTPSSVRVAYTNNYRNSQSQDANVRPCVGACKPGYPGSTGRVETANYPAQQQQGQQFSSEERARAQSRVYENQRYAAERSGQAAEESATAGYALNAQYGGSSFSAGGPSQFAGNSGPRYSGSYQNGRLAVESNGEQRQNQFSVKAGGDSGMRYSGSFGNGRFAVESNRDQAAGAEGERRSQFAVRAGSPRPVEGAASGNYETKAQFGGASFSAGDSGVKGGSNPGVYYSGNFRNGQINVEGGNRDSQNYGGFTGRPVPMDVVYSEQQTRSQGSYQAQRSGFAEQTTPSNVEQFEAYKAPLIRMEKQPGYVDIVYASDKKTGSESRKFENLRAAPESDPRTYGLMEIVKELNGNQRYIIHNFTQGESLNKRNDAARVATESKRIKDLIRYAKEYQEKQGYFEEGMELIYHFGDLGTNNTGKTNETLTRRKRQHANVTEEDDVMHVVVRIRVPTLRVKSNYSLMGKVGKQPMRGSGLLDGNFTDVTADFTVELKKVDNKTMIVRAARAKLVSKDRNIKLQGMDEKGPVNDILNHGLMAAEAVAAMIADDLASKALNEGNSEAMIYKMYKNLPVVDRT